MVISNISAQMKHFEKVVALQTVSFPPEESFPMDKILSLAEADKIHYKSFWEDENLCGIIFYNIGETMLYLFYLAVNSEIRSKGYGTKLLNWLKSEYPDLAVVANIEPLGLDSDNEEQRIRRFSFYERNGFKKLDYRLSDDSGLYDIISNNEKFSVKEYFTLIDELGFGAYHPQIITLK